MRKLRTACMTIPIAAILAVTGLAGGTQKADALVTSADYCAGYIYGWNYWGSEVDREFVRSGGEDTPYLDYAWAKKVAYGRLIATYNC
jgi:hypothetical protein